MRYFDYETDKTCSECRFVMRREYAEPCIMGPLLRLKRQRFRESQILNISSLFFDNDSL